MILEEILAQGNKQGLIKKAITFIRIDLSNFAGEFCNKVRRGIPIKDIPIAQGMSFLHIQNEVKS